MENASTRAISECFIKPKLVVDEANKPFYLGLIELMQMAQLHLQIGLIFDKLPSKEGGGMDFFLERLKKSMSCTLAHFYPLAGQFVTKVDEEQYNCFIFLDCNKGRGAKFIHATLENVTINDITSPSYVPPTVQSFFDLGRMPTNYDAHDEPMLVIQVIELVDGVFLGVSVNHAIVDGTTFWHFLYSWSEIFQSNDMDISRQPIFERWFPEGYGPIIKLLYVHPDEFITRYNKNKDDKPLEAILHFSSHSIATLKAKANADCGLADKISSVQALSALLWRTMFRSRSSQSDERSMCILVSNLRSRLQPPLSQEYFGSFIYAVMKSIRVGELLGNGLGYVALLLNQGVEELTNEFVCDEIVKFTKSPICVKAGNFKPNAILIGGIPRVDVNRLKFGEGKVVAIRAGSNKYDGKVMLHLGIQEEGSINVEICLSRDTMIVFQRDVELMSFVS